MLSVYLKFHTIICLALQLASGKRLVVMKFWRRPVGYGQKDRLCSLPQIAYEENDKLLSRTKASKRTMQQEQ